MGKGKPSGMLAGGKLRDHRRTQRWNDKDYNKANIESKWKRAFGTTSHSSGIVTKRWNGFESITSLGNASSSSNKGEEFPGKSPIKTI